LEKKKKNKCIYSLQPGHLEVKQNDRKLKRSKIKQKWADMREFQVQTSSACENHHRSVAERPMLENNKWLSYYLNHSIIPFPPDLVSRRKVIIQQNSNNHATLDKKTYTKL